MKTLQDDLQFLLDGAGEGIYYTDPDLTIVRWNRQASEITGYPRSQVEGRQCRDNIVKHVDTSGQLLCGTVNCPLIAPQRTGKPYSALAYLHHADGHLVNVTLRTVPNFDASGTLVGVAQYFLENHTKDPSPARNDWQREATTDVLTGVGNRRRFQQSWAVLKRRKKAVLCGIGLLVVDIDNFKKVNDTHGHQHGDKVLKSVAKTLASGIRELDGVFRWGGEEFTLIINPTNPASLFDLAERLRILVSRAWTVLPDNARLSVTVSIGGAVLGEHETVESLFARADERLLYCKKNGRNCSRVDEHLPT